MPTADQQRSFLDAIADDAQPVVYCAHGLSHSVYLTRIAQAAPFKMASREEDTYQLTMVSTVAEATGYESQEQFLLSSVNDVAPLVYTDTRGDRHYVIMTRLSRTFPYKDDDRFQPVYTLTFADARAVLDVQATEVAAVAETLTSASLYRTLARWDEFDWDWAQWE